MSMEINGNYSKINYAEWPKEELAPDRVKKEEEAKKEQNTSVLRDEYISSEKSGAKPSGLYRFEEDENGNRKIVFDDPNKSGQAGGKEQLKIKAGSPEKEQNGGQPKATPKNPEEPEEICTGSTDMVDREIRKLKEEKQQLERQIRSASSDEEKQKELEKKLAQIENELSVKDNEAYRRQHTVFC